MRLAIIVQMHGFNFSTSLDKFDVSVVHFKSYLSSIILSQHDAGDLQLLITKSIIIPFVLQ